MPHRRVAAGALLLAALATLATAAPARAQTPAAPPPPPDDSLASLGPSVTLTGTVHDPAGNPIEGAELRVGRRLEALSDAAGRYVLRGVPVGSTELQVRRIGYRPLAVRVAAATPGARQTVDVEMRPNAVQLSTVLVEGRVYDKALWDQGFYQRRGTGSGHFFDFDEIARFGGAGVGSLVREVPRVDLYRTKAGEFAFGRIAGRACRMNIFLDGAFARYAMPKGEFDQGVGLDALIARSDVHAIEVYPSVNSVPREFLRIGPATHAEPQNASVLLQSRVGARADEREEGLPQTLDDAACGAIVIWSKPFIERRREQGR